ncbi:MAG TPA: hypothetical protein VK828_17580 [Terriglobales bacterium]|nr:hypothetical protein [Terriglobales bacterium]
MRPRKLSAILLFCLCSIPRGHAGATLFLGEPYGFGGALVGAGHSAVYLSRVCATTPVLLRLCEPGETGIVLSRYRSIAGYDWIAIPLVPYLYAVEKQEDIPLFADKKLVAFLRDRYRRNHLESLAPDLPNGETPNGDWYELIGASYIRTIYTFEIETSPEQDAKLIRTLNERSKHHRWNLVTANCADFVRQIINSYYPHSVHRSIIGDLGITTPKQLARTLSTYSSRHPELQTSTFVIPQVPGTIPRSKRVRGVLECVYIGRWHFNPGKNALILDSSDQLVAPLTSADRRIVQDQLEELIRAASSAAADADKREWTSLQAAAEPVFDAIGGPALQVSVGGEVRSVGIARSNILNFPAGYEFAAGLVNARLRQELKSAAARKTARADVESDLLLLQQLLTLQTKELASTASFTNKSWTLSSGATH